MLGLQTGSKAVLQRYVFIRFCFGVPHPVQTVFRSFDGFVGLLNLNLVDVSKIFFGFSAWGRGRGKSEAPGGGGGRFLLKIPGGGGVSRAGGDRGGEGPGRCLRGIWGGGGGGKFFFFLGRNSHQVNQIIHCIWRMLWPPEASSFFLRSTWVQRLLADPPQLKKTNMYFPIFFVPMPNCTRNILTNPGVLAL